MARLPQPGGDNGNWGEILNDFLSQTHNNNGTLKADSVGQTQLQTNAVTADAIDDGSITLAQLSPSLQASIAKADSAYQLPVTGVPTSDLNLTQLDARYQTEASIITLLANPSSNLRQALDALYADGSSGGSSGSSMTAVTITTTGATFAPMVELASGSTATVHWSVGGSDVATGVAPTINFGSAATRTVSMTVINGSTDALADVRVFNLGYDHTGDGSADSSPSSYDHATQAVTGVGNVNAMTGLVHFLAGAQNATTGPLTGTIDFSGMANLTNIECYQQQVTGVTLTGCSSLKRLCLESNQLTTLDLNPVHSTLRDLRAAHQRNGAGLTFAALTGGNVMSQLWHYCIRDQPVTGHFTIAQMPALTQLWNWNTSQSGTLNLNGNTHLAELRSYSNSYSSITGISGATNLQWVDFSNNAMSQSAVDSICTDVNTLGTSGGRRLDLSGTNAAPSSASAAARTSLAGRSWTVVMSAATAPVITTTSLNTLTQNTAFSQTLAASGTATITWSVTVGTLPAGLSLASSTGVLSGTPTGSGSYSFTVTATNSAGSDDQAYSGTIIAAGATTLYQNLFDTDRANWTAIAAGEGFQALTTAAGSTTPSATITSGDLNKTSSGSYQYIAHDGGGSLPADYDVEIVVPSANIGTSFNFLMSHVGSDGNGVRMTIPAYGATTFDFGNSYDFNTNDTANVTTDNGLPASYVAGSDQTICLRVKAGIAYMIINGQTVCHIACSSINSAVATAATTTGTRFGFGGGSAETYRSVIVKTN